MGSYVQDASISLKGLKRELGLSFMSHRVLKYGACPLTSWVPAISTKFDAELVPLKEDAIKLFEDAGFVFHVEEIQLSDSKHTVDSYSISRNGDTFYVFFSNILVPFSERRDGVEHLFQILKRR